MPGYDYTRAGAYFLTIVTQDRVSLFGEIADGRMSLSQAGLMVAKILEEIPNFYAGVGLDEFTIMPNHFHAIVTLVGAVPGDLPRPGRPDPTTEAGSEAGSAGPPPEFGPMGDTGRIEESGQTRRSAPTGDEDAPVAGDRRPNPMPAVERMPAEDVGAARGGERSWDAWRSTGRPADAGIRANAEGGRSIPQLVQRFKTLTTKRYADGVHQNGWPAFRNRLWQRNYFENVIRDDPGLDRIRRYIQNNPACWAEDEENPDRVTR